MKFYELADGTIVGTQADAKASKQSWKPIEIPTDKDGLMEFVNNRQTPSSIPAPVPETDDKTSCPKCKFNSRAAARYAEHIKESARIEGLIERIEIAPTHELIRLIEAAIYRMTEIARASSQLPDTT